MKRSPVRIILAMLSAVIAMSYAPVPMAEDAAIRNLQKVLTERFPEIKIQRVGPSVLPGLYEVVTATEIAYADAGGKHLVIGRIMDSKTRENLTEKRWNELNKIDFNSLPFAQAIKFVKGNGHRKLAIFEDPFCPYCQELERDLQSIDDVTIYVFLYPLEQIHPNATNTARHIWCANNQAKAWTDWILNNKMPPVSDCRQAPIEQLVQLAERLGVNSTPTLFFPDGSRIPGAIDAKRLEAKLTASN